MTNIVTVLNMDIGVLILFDDMLTLPSQAVVGLLSISDYFHTTICGDWCSSSLGQCQQVQVTNDALSRFL